ncbi:MAG: stage sporulation protein [Acidimicrobiaceae bacterium]|jgi:stage II sporulation protein D|nr:stage sporulation protein [Acidimicrobiaceae bacterium]
MQYRRRLGGPALLLLAVVVALAPTTAGVARPTAASRRAPRPPKANQPAKARQPAPPAKPKPGWLVSQARIEPLDGGRGAVGVLGVGAFRGALDIVPAPGGGVAVVNQVGLEDYVRGLAEVPATWPAEALKAQAIAARTYALHELALDPQVATAARGVGAQICATDACQVYAGVAKEVDPDGAASFPNWAAAVADTAGQVVEFQGQPINAKYSSSNGGRSVGGGRPYLKPVDDPDDRFSPLHHWRSQLSSTDVAAALGLGGTLDAVSRVGDLLAVDWHGADGGHDRLTIAASDFRTRVNGVVPAPPDLPRAVPSARFSPGLDVATGTVVLDGGGWGHGIGMSQWGAYGKALRGLKAPDILAAYYGGLRPAKVDPARLPATIRVAVDLGRPEAQMADGARFRVLDGSGHALAVAASGPWRFVPEGKGVRVVPPPGQDGVPAVQALAVDPAAPTATAPVTVRFRLSAPALVRVTVADEAGALPPVALEPGLLDAGESAQALPPPTRAGRYVVTVAADAGGGRTASVPVPVEIRPAPAASSIGPRPVEGPAILAVLDRPMADRPKGTDGRNAAGALAATLLLTVGTAARRRWPA